MKTETLIDTVRVIELSSIKNWLDTYCAIANSTSAEVDDPDYGCVWMWG